MSPQTTWRDLAALGWPINDILQAANAQRGGTMSRIEQLSINGGDAATWEWWSYNALRGKPYLISNTPKSTVNEQTVWSYDNTQNSKSFTDKWTEEWTELNSADLSITTAINVELSASVTILDVASTGFNISISSSSTAAEHKEETHSLSHTWDLDVGPHEKLSIVRVKETIITATEYGQDFGVTDDSMLGTDGEKYNGHRYWGMNINSLLQSPTGTMHILGAGNTISYTFNIVREGPKGKTVELLLGKPGGRPLPRFKMMVPGGGDEDIGN